MMRDATNYSPAQAAFLKLLSNLLGSGRVRPGPGKVGEVVNLYEENSPTRIALRQLTSDELLGVDYTVYFGLNRDAERWHSKDPTVGRRGRFNLRTPHRSR